MKIHKVQFQRYCFYLKKYFFSVFLQIIKSPREFAHLTCNTSFWDKNNWWLYILICLSISTMLFSFAFKNGIITPTWYYLSLVITKKMPSAVYFFDPMAVLFTAFVGFSAVLSHFFMVMTGKKGSLKNLFLSTTSVTATFCLIQSIPVIFWIILLRLGIPQAWVTSPDLIMIWYILLGLIPLIYIVRLIESNYTATFIHSWLATIGLPCIISSFYGLLFLLYFGISFIVWVFLIPISILSSLIPLFYPTYQKIVNLSASRLESCLFYGIMVFLACVIIGIGILAGILFFQKQNREITAIKSFGLISRKQYIFIILMAISFAIVVIIWKWKVWPK